MHPQNHRKDNICFQQLTYIKNFAELGASTPLFELFWSGIYKGIHDTFSNNCDNYFSFSKNPKFGATSWVCNKDAENAAYILIKMHAQMAPDNLDFHRAITKDELMLLAVAYNTKYNECNNISISKIYSLISSIKHIDTSSGIAIFQCSCKNHYITRSSAAPATCHWCRSKIKKSPTKSIIAEAGFKVNLKSLALLRPSNQQKPSVFYS